MIYSEDFLLELEQLNNREVYARITCLTRNELPIEYIEGKVTGGSINIDGASCVRRTCSISMTANEVDINDFYWGFKNKFILEIGLKNNINSNYDDIIWFKLGIYIITSFNCSLGTNNYTINISGKDKMCLLNGDIGGNLNSSVDFGVREDYDTTTGITTYTSIPIKTIIRDAVHTYGDELVENIIINDIENCGLEVMEYRGDKPLYLFKNLTTEVYDLMTLNGDLKCFLSATNDESNYILISSNEIIYDNLFSDEEQLINSPTKISFNKEYTNLHTIAKIECGNVPGYKTTELTYAGDLIANIGESLTSILDKIVKMLGDFEYFYDINGKFIFLAKPCNTQILWNDLDSNDVESRIHKTINHLLQSYEFNSSNLITSFLNTPNLLNLKNDFTVWGKKKTTNGSEIKIHMRCAIDEKPSVYCGIKKVDDELEIDWSRIYINKDSYDPEKISAFENNYNKNIAWVERDIELKNLEDIYQSNIANYELVKNQSISQETEQYNNKVLQNYMDYINGNIRTTIYKKNLLNIQNDFNNKYNAIISKYESDLLDLKNQYLNDIDEIKNASKEKEFKINNFLYDWRELIYQMALDYYKYNTDDNFYYTIKLANDWTESGRTGYEKYYIDLEGFWRLLYNPDPNEDDISDYNEETHWAKFILQLPESLIFWFDFFSISGELGKYLIRNIGDRTKVVNEDSVKSIYYRDIPNVIFIKPNEEFERQTGYTYILILPYMENLFIISSMGTSAKEKIDTLLDDYSHCAESITISAIPIYRLLPNTFININDKLTGISGEYIINKITIPLTYNGTMSITANKNVNSIT